MDEIIEAFQIETKSLLDEMVAILEEVEEDQKKYQRLEKFGQLVDRVMGGAKTLALELPAQHPMHLIGSFSELCKAVGYKGSQVGNNPELIAIVTSLLLDAIETLNTLNEKLTETGDIGLNKLVTATFLNRLQWVTTKFDQNLRSSLAIDKAPEAGNSAKEISDILQKLQKLGVKSP